MSNVPICIVIENKRGGQVTVPLHIWENGLKLDTDWHVYEPPKPKPQPVAPVQVVVKPVPPAAPPVVAEAPPKVKPVAKRKPARGRKPKGK